MPLHLPDMSLCADIWQALHNPDLKALMFAPCVALSGLLTVRAAAGGLPLGGL